MTELPDNWFVRPFEDCIVKKSIPKKSKISKKNYKKNGKIPIIDQGKEFIVGFSDDVKNTLSDFPVVIFGDHTRIFKYVDFPFLLGADGTKILIPNKQILNAKYFYYFLKSVPIENHGYSRHYKFLKEIDVIIPPMETQKEIVNQLEKIDNLRLLRDKSLELSDLYMKSLFIEIFGSIYLNPNNWETYYIKDLVKSTKNENPKNEYPEKYFNYVDISSIDVSIGKITNFSTIKGEDAPSRARQKIQYNDLLVSTVRPNLNGVALVPSNLNNQIGSTGFCILRCDKKILPEYLYYISRSQFFIKSLMLKARGASYPAVTNNDILNLKIPVPPIELQNQFAEIVQQVEIIKKYQNQSKEELDNLFNNLMQKAFKGELIC